MLTIYRRHIKTCAHRSEGRNYRRCHCPIWADGFIGGQEIRQSLKLRDWNKAQDEVRDWEAEGQLAQSAASEPVTIERACAEFERDAEARGLREPTLYKYRLLFRQMQDFARGCGIQFVTQLNVPALRKFRATWANRNLGALKKLEYLRSFLRFCHDNGWLPDNPGRKLKSPKVSQRPTMPFTREEVVKILAACDKYPDQYGRFGQANARRLKALVLLLRYGGLRIQDAVTLPKDRIVDGKLFLYTAKTGTHVYCPLPDFVIKAMDAASSKSAKYFFWTGESDPETATKDWQRSLRKLFRLAELENGHAHRLRDTFAVELLLSGVLLERVSMLLGHSSVRVTERYYSPWVHARQAQLEADVQRSWRADPLLASETKGTPEVHGKREFVN